jgi:hypothetical protein
VLIQLSTALANPIVSNLIEPVDYFSGRNDELKKIHIYLSKYKNASAVGFSGVGKSQIVRKYAFENKGAYELIWFIDCSLNLERQFTNLAREINIKLNKNENLLPENEDARSSILNYISSKKNILIVLDNLKIGQNEVIQDFINFEHNGHIIFCSQDSAGLPQIVRINNLPKNDVGNVLDKIIMNRTSKEKEALNNILKGYPLLIAQAALLLKDNEYLTVEDYKKIFYDQKNIQDHINIALQNLSFQAKSLLYKLALMDNTFSRSCINMVDTGLNMENLQELIRFGLVSDAGLVNNVQTFEMHDIIKGALLDSEEVNVIAIIKLMVAGINNFLPKSSTNRYKLFLDDSTLLNNIEALEQNAILHKVPFLDILALTRHRLIFFLFSRNETALDSIQKWFEDCNDIDFKKILNPADKVNYSECIFVFGLNDSILKQNKEKGYEKIKLAQNIMELVPGEQNFKVSIYGQLAQYYIGTGDLERAGYNLQKMQSLKKQYPEVELSLRLYYLVKTRIFLNTADYENALREINHYLEQEEAKALSNDTFLNSAYLLQAKILNCMKNYQKAKEIILRISNRVNFKVQEDDSIAITLAELSIAELGLNNDKALALDYAEQANDVFKKNKSRNQDILFSKNIYLARVMVTRANALSAMGKFQEAIEEYLIAETIYYNRYKLNMKNIDDVSYMYYNAAVTGKKMGANGWFKKFHNKHLKYFGRNHHRSLELDQLL